MPAWWANRRFGLRIDASLATVPAWAPIGEYAERYRSHVGHVGTTEHGVEAAPHRSPMVEVLAHHRDRWDHIEHYDDFATLLDFEHFDADLWAGLACDAGAGYLIHGAKPHDGWVWWDAPHSTQSLTEHGPRRNVVAELADACERNLVTFGASYSLLDWGDRRDDERDDERDVLETLHAQVLDLVERFGVCLLWGNGHQSHDAGYWDTAELLRKVRSVAPDIVINDGWWASRSDVPDDAPGIVTTFEYETPEATIPGPWELSRGIGQSLGYNRNERPEHHMTGHEIVDLYTEVVAKGGNLVMSVGPAADGSIPEMQAAPLREAGTWISRYGPILATTKPWVTWGDARVRYLDSTDSVDSLVVVDIAGNVGGDVADGANFAALGSSTYRVLEVTAGDPDDDRSVTWTQDRDGLHITMSPPPPATGQHLHDDRIGIAVYRATVEPVEPASQLFERVDVEPTPLDELLADASNGDIVQLGDASYLGPATVPAGVTVRGLGPARTRIIAPDAASTMLPSEPVIRLERGARLEHVSVSREHTQTPAGRRHVGRPVVRIQESSASLLGCRVEGTVEVTADDVLVRAVTARGVIATNADRLHVSHCHFTGTRWDVGVDLRRGGGHQVESNELFDHLCAIRATETTGSTIRGNAISARWWGVHLEHSEDAHVHANRVSATMRAVDVDGGRHAVIDGNAVTDGDSGCIIEAGAADCEVYGNHWDRCRIGLLAWGATALHHQDNVCSSLRHEGGQEEGSVVTGP